MARSLTDLSIRTLRRMLRDTERFVGRDSSSAATIRRVLEQKMRPLTPRKEAAHA